MRTLKISCWNINGLFRKSLNYSKLDDASFLGSVLGYDILGLVETHAGPEDNIGLDNYHTYQVNRPKSNKAQKFSGGLAILIKNDIKLGVSLEKSGEFAIWIKLKSSYFGLNQDL